MATLTGVSNCTCRLFLHTTQEVAQRLTKDIKTAKKGPPLAASTKYKRSAQKNITRKVCLHRDYCLLPLNSLTIQLFSTFSSTSPPLPLLLDTHLRFTSLHHHSAYPAHSPSTIVFSRCLQLFNNHTFSTLYLFFLHNHLRFHSLYGHPTSVLLCPSTIVFCL